MKEKIWGKDAEKRKREKKTNQKDELITNFSSFTFHFTFINANSLNNATHT